MNEKNTFSFVSLFMVIETFFSEGNELKVKVTRNVKEFRVHLLFETV